MSEPIRRRVCGTYLSERRSDEPQSDGDTPQSSDSDIEPQTSSDTPKSDRGTALDTLAAATTALQAGAAPKLFGRAPARRKSRRLDTVDDAIAAFRSGVSLTGAEMARIYQIWRREMRARGLPLDWFTRSAAREDDPPLQ